MVVHDNRWHGTFNGDNLPREFLFMLLTLVEDVNEYESAVSVIADSTTIRHIGDLIVDFYSLVVILVNPLSIGESVKVEEMQKKVRRCCYLIGYCRLVS